MTDQLADQKVVIRPARPDDFEAIARISVDSYTQQGVIVTDDPYLPTLRDVGGRVADPTAQVLVAEIGDHLVGTVTICPFGSMLTEVSRAGEFEFRMLAVAERFQRLGVAVALIDACAEVGRELGLHTMVACVTETNLIAQQLYASLGFARVPERDWQPQEDVLLQTYTLPLPATYCGRCGEPIDVGDHSECEQALTMEPPRYCRYCRRRMVVQVVPQGWRARCKVHGDLIAG